MSHAIRATPGFHGSGVKERTSGIAARSGSLGLWPISPAANPANPAPSSISPSRWVAGTSFAFGLPCMSTNCANRNSTPLSSMYLRTSSSDSGAVNGFALVIWRRKLPLGGGGGHVGARHPWASRSVRSSHGPAAGACLHSGVRPMCGIAGLFSKSLDVSGHLGGHLADMLLQLSDRGPDSAGIAVYRDPAPSGSSKVSLFSPDPDQDWEAVRDALAEAFGAGEPEVLASHAVIVVETDAEVAQAWVREHLPRLRVMSAGQTIEIF